MFHLFLLRLSAANPLLLNTHGRSKARVLTTFAMFTVALTTIACVLFSAAPSDAQRRVRPPVRVGEKVEVGSGGATVQGEVVAIDSRNGLASIRIDINGEQKTVELPYQFLRPVKNAAPARVDGANKVAEKESAKRELREWADSSGSYKVKARFVKLAEDKVTLEKEDGNSVTVPLAKLSDADQKIARQLAKGPAGNPFVPINPSTASEGSKLPSSEKPLNRTSPLDGTAPVEGDWSQVRSVAVNTSADAAVPPDAATWEKIPSPRPMLLRSPPARSERDYFFEKLHGMFLNRSRQLMIVASVNGDSSKALGVRLEACDLKSAKSLGAVILGTPKPPVDLSPDGTCVVCAPDRSMLLRGDNIPSGVEIWRLAEGGSLVKRWIAGRAEDNRMSSPHGRNMSEDTKRRIAQMDAFWAAKDRDRSQPDLAYFISDAEVLTVSTATGDMTLWNVADARAIYTLKANGPPAFSANRTQMAVGTPGRQLCILETATGKTIAALPEQQMNGKVAFRPDGRQIASCLIDRLQVWDLAEKKLTAEIAFPPHDRYRAGHLDWLDDQHILMNGSILFDVGRQIVLWRFETRGRSEFVFDGTLCYAYSSEGRGFAQTAICFIALPHAEALRAAESLKLDEIAAMRPGSQVSLDLTGLQANITAANLQALSAAYEEQLKKNGVRVVAGSPISLKATLEGSLCRVAFVENGKLLWEDSWGGMATNGKEGFDPFTYLSSIRLPGRLVRYGDSGCFGTSELGPPPGMLR